MNFEKNKISNINLKASSTNIFTKMMENLDKF